MSERPLASIIINNFNYARFIGDAIDSALAQDYLETEVVVVDDGSTDDSRRVIERYGNRVRAVFKENGGQGSAYNAGFAISVGDAVCFLDADDTLFPQAMERAVARIDCRRPAKVQWPLELVNAAGAPTGELSTRRAPPEGDLREMVIREGPFYDWYLTTGALYPRWMLQRVFPVPEVPYRLGSDEYLTTLAPVFGEVVNVSEPLGTYRQHDSNNYAGHALDDRKIREYLRRFDDNCVALQRHLRLMGLEADVPSWKRRNFNCLWPERLLRAKQDIARLVPKGAAYVLVNGDEWGGGEPVPGRRALPFTERDGIYAGPPSDDEHALRELDRMRQAGAVVIIIWWTSFWWLEHYRGLADHLGHSYRCLMDADHLIAFDMRAPLGGIDA